MFTSIDKAIAAAISAALTFAALQFGWDVAAIGLTPQVVETVVSALVPALVVYFIPNKGTPK